MQPIKKQLRIPLLAILSPTLIFMISTMVVNAGNYGYNLVLGRVLSPAQFSEAGLMITLLLVASFIAMTFQIVATKFTIDLESRFQVSFRSWFEKLGLISGGLISIGLILFSTEISEFFQLSNKFSMVVFAAVIPVFFLMSVKRGYLQGKEDFIALSASYQIEMWARLLFTFALIFLVPWNIDVHVSIAITGSVILGYLIIDIPSSLRSKGTFCYKKHVLQFLFLTAGYEGSQILINYTDILLVKHYFDAASAGMYTSMALIGRMIYFMTWMVVMILIPKVLRLRKEGGDYQNLLINYFLVIAAFSGALIVGSFLFAEQLVTVLFGEAYLSVAPLLWQYGLATMLFALANVLVYYFLSLDHKTPVFIAIFFGLTQVALFLIFHRSLEQMIHVQIVNMAVLLVIMIAYFKLRNN